MWGDSYNQKEHIQSDFELCNEVVYVVCTLYSKMHTQGIVVNRQCSSRMVVTEVDGPGGMTEHQEPSGISS